MPGFSLNSMVLSSTCVMRLGRVRLPFVDARLEHHEAAHHGAQDVAFHRADAVRRVHVLDVALDAHHHAVARRKGRARQPRKQARCAQHGAALQQPASRQPEIHDDPPLIPLALSAVAAILCQNKALRQPPASQFPAPAQQVVPGSDEIALDFKSPGAGEDARVAFIGVEAGGDEEGVLGRRLHRRGLGAHAPVAARKACWSSAPPPAPRAGRPRRSSRSRAPSLSTSMPVSSSRSAPRSLKDTAVTRPPVRSISARRSRLGGRVTTLVSAALPSGGSKGRSSSSSSRGGRTGSVRRLSAG